MANAIDWTNPKTFKPSNGEYKRYVNDDTRSCNHAARKDPSEPVLAAMRRHKGSYETTKINGKSIDEIIGSL